MSYLPSKPLRLSSLSCLLTLLSVTSHVIAFPAISAPPVDGVETFDISKRQVSPFPKTCVKARIVAEHINLAIPAMKMVFDVPRDGRAAPPTDPKYNENRDQALTYYYSKVAEVRSDAERGRGDFAQQFLRNVADPPLTYSLAPSPGAGTRMFGLHYIPRRDNPRIILNYSTLIAVLEYCSELILRFPADTDGQFDISFWPLIQPGDPEPLVLPDGAPDFSISTYIYWLEEQQDETVDQAIANQTAQPQPQGSLGGLASFNGWLSEYDRSMPLTGLEFPPLPK